MMKSILDSFLWRYYANERLNNCIFVFIFCICNTTKYQLSQTRNSSIVFVWLESIILAVQLTQQKGHTERGMVATLSQSWYLIAIPFWTIKECEHKNVSVNCFFREKVLQKKLYWRKSADAMQEAFHTFANISLHYSSNKAAFVSQVTQLQ